MVLVVGSVNMDLVLSVDRFPQPGETISATALNYYPGGKGANQAVAIARLGGSVQLVGRVGTDAYGSTLLEGLQQYTVDTTYVEPLEETSSGLALITVDAIGQNSIVILPGANGKLDPESLDGAFRNLSPETSLFLTQLELPLETVERAITLASDHGLRTILNAAPAQPLSKVREIIAKTDILVLNETETHLLTNIDPKSEVSAYQAADNLRKLGPSAVIITLGASGSIFVDDEVRQKFSSPDVKAVDTTAAGDAFIGGLCSQLLSGQSLTDAVRFGNYAGAYAVTQPGAQPSLPSFENVLELGFVA